MLIFRTWSTESMKQSVSLKHKSPPWLTFKTKDSKTSSSGLISLFTGTTSKEKWHSCSQIKDQECHQAQQRCTDPCIQRSTKKTPKHVPHAIVIGISENMTSLWMHDACTPYNNSLFSVDKWRRCEDSLNRLTNLREQTCGCQGGEKGGSGVMEWDFRLADVNYYTQNKQQGHMYSTGNYIQYPLTDHNERECEKGDIYIHIHIYT